MNRKWLGAALAVGALASAAVPAGASAAGQVYVGKDTNSCPNSTFTSIQEAVAVSPAGTRIVVCPGTYTEQVTIPATKDGDTLVSQKPWQAIIQAPTPLLPPAAIVNVTGAHAITLQAFTIEGPGTVPGSLQYGVRVAEGGSATIEYNHITHIRDNPLSGDQNGVAVAVGDNTDGTPGSATVLGNLVDDYQKNGITVEHAGSQAAVTANAVRGVGPTGVIAQNGIQVSDGAAAQVSSNAVSGDVYTGASYSATGILISQPGQLSVTDNYVSSNDNGIYAQASDHNTTIDGNRVSRSTYDGIDLDSSTGPTVTNNDSSHNGNTGIAAFNATTTASIRTNTTNGNVQDGLFADGTTMQNLFGQNTASGNNTGGGAFYDCQDQSTGVGTAHTANYWLNDRGQTSSPPGICRPGRR